MTNQIAVNENIFPTEEIQDQINAIAAKMQNERPADKVVIASAPFFWNGEPAGAVWVEILGRASDHPRFGTMLNVEALTGKDIFPQGGDAEGFYYYSAEASFRAPTLKNVAVIENGEVVKYRQNPFAGVHLIEQIHIEEN